MSITAAIGFVTAALPFARDIIRALERDRPEPGHGAEKKRLAFGIIRDRIRAIRVERGELEAVSDAQIDQEADQAIEWAHSAETTEGWRGVSGQPVARELQIVRLMACVGLIEQGMDPERAARLLRTSQAALTRRDRP